MRMPTISRGRAVAYLAVVVVLLVVGGRLLLGGSSEASASGDQTLTLAPLEVETGATEETAQPALVVHVAGAVRRPGLYRLRAGSRVADAIRKAGGARPKAALALVNLAALVADGEQIVVPTRGAPAPSGIASSGSPSGPVHLNSATLEELDALPGVGPVTAQKILDYREKNGPFASVDELDAVPGIGPTRLEQLRELLAL